MSSKRKEEDEADTLTLVDQHGELLLECKVGDKYHRLLLEAGMKAVLEMVVQADESGEEADRALEGN